jgi:malonyl CoA-acyl carrier protein transacylase
MGRDLADAFPAARHVFQEVDDALGQKLSKLMWEGPQEELTLTANAQPALMAHSLAVVRALEAEGGFGLAERVALVAGHSLGEYSALTAAGAFDIATAAKLLRLRGEAMQKATPPGTGAMAALLGAEIDLAQEICAAAATNPETGKAEVVEAANDNGGGQVVISGTKAAVERANAIEANAQVAASQMEADASSERRAAAKLRRELEAEEALIAAEKPRLAAAGLNALQEVKDAEDALGLAPQPEALVPRKRARNVPTREDSARQQQIEILEEALNPLSTNIKRALFEMGQQGQAQQGQAQGPPPQYISSWTADSIMASANQGASTVPILRSVIKASLGTVGVNRSGNPPNKKQLFALIKKHGLEQDLANAVAAAGR